MENGGNKLASLMSKEEKGHSQRSKGEETTSYSTPNEIMVGL